jgi:hypothetical protein
MGMGVLNLGGRVCGKVRVGGGLWEVRGWRESEGELGLEGVDS